MTATKETPLKVGLPTSGPWYVKKTLDQFWVKSDAGAVKNILSTSWHSSIRGPYPFKDEAFANATLAAAAPELYEALLAIVTDWERKDGPTETIGGLIQRARPALAKARVETV